MYNSIATKLSEAVSPHVPDAHLSCSLPNGLMKTIPLQHKETLLTFTNTLEPIKENAQAMICRARKRYYLQILEANAQTYVNDQLIKDACSLKDGDLIRIGDGFVVCYTETHASA